MARGTSFCSRAAEAWETSSSNLAGLPCAAENKGNKTRTSPATHAARFEDISLQVYLSGSISLRPEILGGPKRSRKGEEVQPWIHSGLTIRCVLSLCGNCLLRKPVILDRQVLFHLRCLNGELPCRFGYCSWVWHLHAV